MRGVFADLEPCLCSHCANPRTSDFTGIHYTPSSLSQREIMDFQVQLIRQRENGDLRSNSSLPIPTDYALIANQIAERDNLVLFGKLPWREPIGGAIRGKMNFWTSERSSGELVLTNGIDALVKTATGAFYLCHLQWFVPDEPLEVEGNVVSRKKESKVAKILKEYA